MTRFNLCVDSYFGDYGLETYRRISWFYIDRSLVLRGQLLRERERENKSLCKSIPVQNPTNIVCTLYCNIIIQGVSSHEQVSTVCIVIGAVHYSLLDSYQLTRSQLSVSGCLQNPFPDAALCSTGEKCAGFSLN